ncbi:nucleotide exchange factor GrpE [Candidatus Saccharibacteria bacterium]|nr:nucleotide exchange factor GrpE [Candidatus Saccharibacteria bacterium]
MTKKSLDYKEIAQQLAQENDSLNDALLRERADAMNVRKRAEEDRIKMGGFYKAMVVKELLPTIDNFERALKSLPKDLEGNDFIAGIEKTVKQFGATLKKLGVERIKTVGEHFDPNLHEAVTMEEGDGEHEIVSEELQSGYIMGEEVIRHAMVRVKAG